MVGGNLSERQKTKEAIEAIIFTWTIVEGVQYPYDPVVVTLNIANYDVKYILGNNGSTVDVFFYDALLRVNISLA